MKRSPNREATNLVDHLEEIADDECVFDDYDVEAIREAAREIKRLRKRINTRKSDFA